MKKSFKLKSLESDDEISTQTSPLKGKEEMLQENRVRHPMRFQVRKEMALGGRQFRTL